ncbi:hypothetical protein N1851_015639 [Merluccius polli]|uniref:Integrase catalytic domain-containing protein n=1 Tax=Merluccius polli TaxID=89951 RepID=A0AA47MSQ2_MERPO|nr:hypothetical protein N1851_015639 [Merluccius polli]
MALKEQPHTRRGILSVVSSIYDPLGFLAPLTLSAKLILQDLCRRSIGWDDQFATTLQQQWIKWLKKLERVTAFAMDRCLKPPDFGQPTHCQLHHFSDASERGYGTVTYLRMQNNHNHNGWIEGPEFLQKAEEAWPVNILDSSIAADDPEVKKELMVNAVIVEDTQTATQRLMSYFSDWNRLKRSVAWFLKIGKVLQEMERFPGNRKGFPALSSGKCEVKKQSRIYKLDPILKDGLLRVGGRLSKAAMPEETKHPVILSKDQRVSSLIVKHIHEQLGHSGRNHVLSRLRRKYWITSANTATRKILSNCGFCRHHKGKLGEQKMADLPVERIIPDLPPFTNVGVDYFGPIKVKRGRSLEKRYGSSTFGSCVLIGYRRGQVSHLRSDNGTNFIGAERELREALAALNHSKIQDAFLQEGIKWSFNPPTASHHGGVWERIIRMVRQILTSVLHQQTLNDEGFHTVLCEVESILNDRPITMI